jgi:hypothetical protein
VHVGRSRFGVERELRYRTISTLVGVLGARGTLWFSDGLSLACGRASRLAQTQKMIPETGDNVLCQVARVFVDIGAHMDGWGTFALSFSFHRHHAIDIRGDRMTRITQNLTARLKHVKTACRIA